MTQRAAAPLRVEQAERSTNVALRWIDHDDLRTLTGAALVITAGASVMAALGVPPIPIMWPLYRLGIVLPGCGLTRGVVAIARGDMAAAWRWNPASFAAAALAAAGTVRFVVGILTGRWLQVAIRLRWWMLVLAAVAASVLWTHQQANAELLMHR